MHLIFLNRYFYPDHSATSQMLSDLAFALANRGHRVDVITSRQIYDAPETTLKSKETVGSVAIHRVWTSRFGRRKLMGRAFDYLTFYIFAAAALWRLAPNGDIVIAKTDPPMLSIIAAPIARLRGARLVTWLQDLFPEVAEAAGLISSQFAKPYYAALHFVRNRSLRAAAMNVALGTRMSQRLKAEGINADRISIIQNWADSTLIKPIDHPENALRSALGLQDKFVVGYSGNLGRAHEYDTMLGAIEDLEDKELRIPGQSSASLSSQYQILWLFIGGGALYDAFSSEVQRRGRTSAQFKPYQNRERLAESLSAIDVHLVSLRPEFEGLVVPSKFYGIAAAGRPVIFVGDRDGEIARLVEHYGCGRSVARGDGVGLAQIILELAGNPTLCQQMGKRARQAFESEFDKPLAVARWEKLFLEVSGSANPSTHADSLPESESGVATKNAL